MTWYFWVEFDDGPGCVGQPHDDIIVSNGLLGVLVLDTLQLWLLFFLECGMDFGFGSLCEFKFCVVMFCFVYCLWFPIIMKFLCSCVYVYGCDGI